MFARFSIFLFVLIFVGQKDSKASDHLMKKNADQKVLQLFSLKTLQDFNEPKNLRKNNANMLSVEKFPAYKHQQGFFCDFEDLISRKKKIRFNLGLDGIQ